MLRVSASPPGEAQPLVSPPDYDTPSGNLTSRKSSSFLLRHCLLLPLFLFTLLSILLISFLSLLLRRLYLSYNIPSIPAVHSPLPQRPYLRLRSPLILQLRYNLQLSNAGFGVPVNLTGVVPTNLLPLWFATFNFAGEIVFHYRLLSHRCRTLNPSSASAF